MWYFLGNLFYEAIWLFSNLIGFLATIVLTLLCLIGGIIKNPSDCQKGGKVSEDSDTFLFLDFFIF